MEERITKALSIINSLNKKGVLLWYKNGKIGYKANAGVLNNTDIANLKAFKTEILDILKDNVTDITIQNNIADRYEPFVLTDVQQSYLMGRNNLFEYGDVACHIYLQLNYPKLDVDRVECVWNELVKKHEMLRAVIFEEGYQKILKDAPYFKVKYYGDKSPEEIQEEMGHNKYTIGEVPYFSVAVSDDGDGSIMHFSIEFIIADWTSIWILLSQFEALYFGKIDSIPDVNVSFRDYVIAERELKSSSKFKLDKSYWLEKLENFPEAPKIDVNRYDSNLKARFERKFLQLPLDKWENIKKYALKNAITPTTLVLMVYASVLEKYSQNKRFALNLTVLNRQPLHEEVNTIIGDFTSLNLLEVDFDNDNSFIENCKQTNSRLFEDLDHTLYSGVEFMRELNRKKGKDASFMPYVFTSAIGLLSSIKSGALQGMVTGIGISQTPQVFIDCQVMDGSFGMQANWDIRKGVFDENTINDMFDCFKNILTKLGENPTVDDSLFRLPQNQVDILAKANDTTLELPKHLLHENIIKQAEKTPDKIAIVCDDKSYTYKQLMDISYGIYCKLIENGSIEKQLIGVSIEKSIYQVATVIAILSGNGVYVPFTMSQGKKRTESIINKTGITTVVTTSNIDMEYPENVNIINADILDYTSTGKLSIVGLDTDLAYIIFTSGSTGEPKGVAITHEGAVNTIEDINRMYNVTSNDSVLGISQLNFDLSVYDIFGLLSVGGTVVYPTSSRVKEPAYISKLVQDNKVTIWNSVPSLLQMLMLYADSEKSVDLSSIRLVLLSGDWIPLNLPNNFLEYSKDAQVVSLGGATEASIWSIYHNYNGRVEGFNSIPYGKPLANQKFRILDKKLNDCPIGVKGEIYILGKGLATGYYNDIEKTNAQFIKDKSTGEMMYKTGDLGKYHSNGEIEFLGRADHQIKLNGHRIELGEIEHAIDENPKVENSAVVYYESNDEKSLLCYYETKVNSKEERSSILEKSERLYENLNANAELTMNHLTKKVLDDAVLVKDNAIMQSMIFAIKNCINSDEFTMQQLLECGSIDNQYKWLVEYWVKLLVNNNYITKSNDSYKINAKYSNVSMEDINSLWADLKSNWLSEMGADIFYDYLYKSSTRLNKLLCKQEDPIKLLYPDGKNDIVLDMYVNNKMSKYLNICICEFVNRFVKSQDRKVNILEVGAGTCATSEQVMRTLGDSNYTYHVTDINKFFIPNAKKKFENNNRVSVYPLNIDEDIYAQGFSDNSYDIIIAVGVLENAKDILNGLNNIKKLIKPNGFFLFTEPVKEEVWILASQGFLMTKPEDSLRQNKAFLDSNDWLNALNIVDNNASTVVFPKNDSPLKSFGLELFIKQFKTNKYNLESSELKDYIKEYLPTYMIPSSFSMLDNLPITANSKIDRKQLLELAKNKISNSVSVKSVSVDNQNYTELQKEILSICENTGIRGIQLNDNLFEYGADSLIMAQITGKLRESIAKNIPFDELLRFILNHPTIIELSRFIEDKSCVQDTSNDNSSNNSIGEVKFYDAGDGPLRVVFHSGLGTVNNMSNLITEMIHQNKGKVMTISIKDIKQYCQLNKDTCLQTLVDDYAKLILETGYKQVQLIGHSFGAWLSTQTANRLQEADVEIVDMVLIDAQTIPWKINNELFMELMFMPNFNVDFNELGIVGDTFDFMKITEKFGCIPEDVLDKIKSDSELSYMSVPLEKLSTMSKDERFQKYADIVNKKSNEKISPDILKSYFEIFAQTTHCITSDIDAYVGDVRYVNAKESYNSFYSNERSMEFWRDICLGDFEVFYADGNHYSCVEDPTNAKKLAELIEQF